MSPTRGRRPGQGVLTSLGPQFPPLYDGEQAGLGSLPDAGGARCETARAPGSACPVSASGRSGSVQRAGRELLGPPATMASCHCTSGDRFGVSPHSGEKLGLSEPYLRLYSEDDAWTMVTRHGSLLPPTAGDGSVSGPGVRVPPVTSPALLCGSYGNYCHRKMHTCKGQASRTSEGTAGWCVAPCVFSSLQPVEGAGLPSFGASQPGLFSTSLGGRWLLGLCPHRRESLLFKDKEMSHVEP